jgi:ankyrin repeat protein
MDIFDAIQKNDPEGLTRLLDEEPSALDARRNGVSPLLWALYHGRPELARQLIARGAPVSFAEACALGDGEKALGMLGGTQAPRFSGGVNTAGRDAQRLAGGTPALRDDINTRSEDGFPPLGLAIFFGHGELARELIARGADVNAAAENAQRVAPLHAAAAVYDRETMRLLLERGADPNARQQADFTPLHGAASRGDEEAARLLLAHGADPKAKSADGKTPADVARERGYPNVAEFLASQ